MEHDQLARFLSEGLSLEQIGVLVSRHPSTVAYWVKKHGLVAAHRDRHVGRGGLERAAVEGLIEAGAAAREMAQRLGGSPTTVRHWVTSSGLPTAAAPRRSEVG